MARQKVVIESFDSKTGKTDTLTVWTHEVDYHDLIDGNTTKVTIFNVCDECGENIEDNHEYELHREECYSE